MAGRPAPSRRPPLRSAATALLLVPAALVAPGTAHATGDAASAWALSTHRVCAPADARHAGCDAVRAEHRDAATGAPRAYTATSGFTASQLRTAYRVTASGSPSTVVAVVDAYDAPTVAADLAAYRAAMGLPAMDTGCAVAGTSPSFAITPSVSGQPCFAKVNQSGAVAPLPAADAGWAQEIDLDVQMVSALCPSCSILLVEGTTNGLGDLASAVTTASRFSGVSAISNSYGTGVGSDVASSSFPAYANAAAAGIAVTVSTGDNGYGTSFPSTVPQAIAVGGTSLTLNSDGSVASQRAWSGAGSGCSVSNAALSWQSTPATSTACGSSRPTADVSAVADPATGVSVYYAGSWLVFGGTSVSAPVVGAWLALTGGYSATRTASQHVWQDLAWSDVTSGSNGSCSPAVLCTAAPGWDGPTGLGALPAAVPTGQQSPTPVLGTPASTVDGFTVAVSGYDPAFTWTATSTAGTAAVGAASSGVLPVRVGGLAAGQRATLTVTSSAPGWTSASSSSTGAATQVPTSFGAVTQTSTGFKVSITNYDPAYTYAVIASAGSVSKGGVSGSALPLAVTGLTAWGTATVTVTATRTGWTSRTGSVTGSALPLTPTFSTPARTTTGFTVNVTNYSSACTFTVTTSAGTVTRGTATTTSLPLTVTGLAPGQSATVTVVVSKSGAVSTGSASVMSAAKLATALLYTGATTGAAGTKVTLSATLTASATGGGVGSRTVKFTVAGKTWSATTTSAGVASVAVTLPTTRGAFTLTATWAGDGTYAPASASAPFTVA